uniref:Fibroblast growth factor receptor homolog 1-like n=1 Tax=Paramormyrops kingsleyae TaxID=1676925 RepID=A0A3B3SLE8_9TELE|nr:fibroblast growth factor receptor homolog 1-like [Paramormyrops kingsleyae]
MLKVSPPESPIMAVPSVQQVEEPASESPLKRQRTKTSSRLLWKPPQQGPRFTKADLNLQQLIKAGKEGVYYKAKMSRGTCKGHSIFTCKITKEGVTSKRVQMEVSIMKKLVHHRNVLQLLDWNITEEPYVLLMEFVNYGTLRNFLQLNQETLSTNEDLQHLFTIASYHIALALEHLHSKMVVHCDLALRNVLVHHFPMEVKLGEFGLARDLTRMRSRRSSHKKTARERVPLRWYPPEYFRNSYYNFKGDVWAFGILLWEMHTFGTLPYPSLETSEEVVCYVCAGQRNADPEGCRPEILQMMKDCWLELHSHRPSFTDIVRILDNILENDSDYVDVDGEKLLGPGEP